MSDAPAISIILPAYNAAGFLDRTLDGVFAQTRADWEMVVIDDGSRDGTEEVARRREHDPRVRVFRCENGGEPTARNRGLARTDPRSEFVLFLDHDDVLFPECLGALADALAADPKAVGAYGSGHLIDMQDAPTHPGELERWCRDRRRLAGGHFVPVAPEEPTRFPALAYKCCIGSMSACLLRRRALPPGDPFRPDMRSGSADLHLYLRLALQGDFLFLDRPLYKKRLHADNITANQEAIDRSVLTALRSVARTERLTPEQRAAVTASLREKLRARARDRREQAWSALRARKCRWFLRSAAECLALSARAGGPLP